MGLSFQKDDTVKIVNELIAALRANNDDDRRPLTRN
jgi:hypothetical protein